MKDGKFTVGFLTYDRKHKAAISLATLVMLPHVGELLIADNGYDNHLPTDFWHIVALAKMRGVKVRYEATLTGLSKGRKWLYENARCEYLMFVDDDMVYEPTILVHAKQALENGATAVHGLQNNLYDFTHPIDGGGGIKFSSLDERLQMFPPSFQHKTADLPISPFGGTVCLRTGLDLFEWVEDYPDLCDDVILLTELLSKGYNVQYCKEMVAHHLRDDIRPYAGSVVLWDSYKKGKEGQGYV